jgi:hypothetical protein
MTKLFHNLIKVFQDGILLTSNDNEILYSNNKILEIFDLNTKGTLHDTSDQAIGTNIQLQSGSQAVLPDFTDQKSLIQDAL